ncbi:MAG: 50S ribosomal protein L21 [Desulfobacterales bacterium]|nr:50S ribosomal protein L21 [Desulfobacterales bacterium]
MYAVVHSGGKQYKVQKDEILRVEKLPGEVGSKVSFDRVLMFSDGENVRIGQPVLDDVTVEGHIVEQGKHKKIIVFKYKKRKRYRKKQGHRQQYTAIRIDNIGGQDSGQTLSEKEEIKPDTELEQKTEALSEE